MSEPRDILERLCAGAHLAQEESEALFRRVVRGELSELELAAILVALKAKGETAPEIAGAATALRDSALTVETAGLVLADTCGTGGDGASTVNISTAAALVVAEAGLAVAKHGNRSVSSRCGSADVLEAAGVKIDVDPATARRCLASEGICFLFAPSYHPGMRHALPVRRALGVRTLFNVLGPLCNPARPAFQLVGVYEPRLCRPVAETLGLLGVQAALVVHGGGLDELALHAASTAALWRDGRVEALQLTPEEAGLARHPVAALAGGGAADNARWLAALLDGRGSVAQSCAVSLNAGALLWIAGRAPDLGAGVRLATEVLQSGRAGARLRRWAEVSHGAG